MSATRWQVRAARPIAYDVVKAPALFAPGNDTLLQWGRRGGRRLVAVDANVWRLHGPRIQAWFEQQGLDARFSVLPSGEEHKSIEAWQGIVAELNAFPVHRRDDPLIAIGGGVLTDVAAFAASCWRRGIPHIKVPTTLMGYIDAALGIKNGINFGEHKNRIGHFTPPLAVLLDRVFLATLPRRHLANGLCEIIKLAVACDEALFELLEQEGAASMANAFREPAGEAILDRAITTMLHELEPDLHEDELARKTDYGHTFSYGLEMHHGERLLHGEAVLLDCLISALIAQRRGLLAEQATGRLFALVAGLGIALDARLLDAAIMWQSLQERIRHRNGLQRVPLPVALGECTFVNDIARAELEAALPLLQSRLARTQPESALEQQA